MYFGKEGQALFVKGKKQLLRIIFRIIPALFGSMFILRIPQRAELRLHCDTGLKNFSEICKRDRKRKKYETIKENRAVLG